MDRSLVSISIIVCFLLMIFIFYRFRYSEKIEGVCVKVETVVSKISYETRTSYDNRVYIPYIKFEYNGENHIGKSIRKFYGKCNIFPGDKIIIRVRKDRLDIVKIVSIKI